MNYGTQKQSGSSLARTVSGFAHALSAIGIFIPIPLMENHVRPDIYLYFIGTFSHDIALWGSWAFVGVLLLCAFFGISVILQIIVQLVMRQIARRSVL